MNQSTYPHRGRVRPVVAAAVLVTVLAVGAALAASGASTATTAPNETATVAPNQTATVDLNRTAFGSNATINVTEPANGTATVVENGIEYTADQNATGTDRFEYTVDTANGSDTGWITVDINTPPAANDTTLSVVENDSATTTLDATDSDGDPLTYEVPTDPANGSVDLNATTGALTYTPKAGFVGTETVEYEVSDGSANDTATLAITVEPSNRAPNANFMEINVTEGDTWNGSFDVSDPDGDDLDVEVIEDPTNGNVSVEGTDFTYTPDTESAVADGFTYRVTDGEYNETAQVAVTIELVNDPPSAANVSASTVENESVSGDFDVSDPDDEQLNVTTGAVANGTLTVDNRSFEYTPNPGFVGNETVEYEVSDGNRSDHATLTITVEPNQPPVAEDIAFTVTEGDTWNGSFDVSDPDGDDLDVEIIDEPTNGNVSVEGTNFTYTPDTESAVADGFTYRVTDGEYNETAQVAVTIELVNDPPSAANVSASTVENESVSGDFDVHDPDDEQLNVTTATAANGTLTVENRSFEYTPDPGFVGTETVEYEVSDGSANDTATLTITVDPNEPPVATNETHVTTANETLRVPVNASDPDGDDLNYSIAERASNGSARIENGTLVYDAESTFEGVDRVTVAVSDGIETTNATIDIAVDRPGASQYATHRTVSVLHGRESRQSLVDRWEKNLSVETIAAPDRGEIDVYEDEPEIEYRPPTNTTGTGSYVFRLDTPDGPEIGVVRFAVVRDETPPEILGLDALAPKSNTSEVYLETDEALANATATFTNESGAVVDRIDLDRHRVDIPQDMFAYRAKTTLSPGEYDLRVEATDFEGQTVEQETTATVTSGGPTIENEWVDFEPTTGWSLTGFANVTGTNVSSVQVWPTGLDVDPIELTRNETDENRYDIGEGTIPLDSSMDHRYPMLVIEAHDETGRTVQGIGSWISVDERPPDLSLSATATDGDIDVQVDHSEPLDEMTVRVSGPETRSTRVFEYDETMTGSASFESLPNGSYDIEVTARDEYYNDGSAGPTTVQVGTVPDDAESDPDDAEDSTGSGGLSVGGDIDIETDTPTDTPGGGAVQTTVDREQTTTPTTTTTATETPATTTSPRVVQRKPDSTDQSGPGFGVVAALIAVCAAAGMLTRR